MCYFITAMNKGTFSFPWFSQKCAMLGRGQRENFLVFLWSLQFWAWLGASMCPIWAWTLPRQWAAVGIAYSYDFNLQPFLGILFSGEARPLTVDWDWLLHWKQHFNLRLSYFPWILQARCHVPSYFGSFIHSASNGKEICRCVVIW